MFEQPNGIPRKMDVGFVPSPSGAAMHVWQEEEHWNCYVVMIGYAPHLDAPNRIEAPALLTGVGCLQSVFGYPNEEAYWKDPGGTLDHGCYEIVGSGWAARLAEYNVRSYGTDLQRWGGDLTHYFIGSKDASFQMLARDLTCEVFPETSYQSVVELSHERARWRPAPTPEEIQQRERYRAAVRERYGRPPGSE